MLPVGARLSWGQHQALKLGVTGVGLGVCVGAGVAVGAGVSVGGSGLAVALGSGGMATVGAAALSAVGAAQADTIRVVTKKITLRFLCRPDIPLLPKWNIIKNCEINLVVRCY
jgi:hypothetical protein